MGIILGEIMIWCIVAVMIWKFVRLNRAIRTLRENDDSIGGSLPNVDLMIGTEECRGMSATRAMQIAKINRVILIFFFFLVTTVGIWIMAIQLGLIDGPEKTGNQFPSLENIQP